jgi:hypothetical protein
MREWRYVLIAAISLTTGVVVRAQEEQRISPLFKSSSDVFLQEDNRRVPSSWFKESAQGIQSTPSAGLDITITRSDLLQHPPSIAMSQKIKDLYCGSPEFVREGAGTLASKTTNAIFELEKNAWWAALAVDVGIKWGGRQICPPSPTLELKPMFEGNQSDQWRKFDRGLERVQ